MKSGLRMLGLVCALVFNGAAMAQVQERQAVRTFLNALFARDEVRLLAFTQSERVSSSAGKLDPYVYDFLYKPRPGSKTVLEIAKIDKLLFKIFRQPDDTFIVIFYPKKYHWNVNNDVKFLETQWLEKYFACWFELREGKLRLHANFCFAETDGPFPPEY